MASHLPVDRFYPYLEMVVILCCKNGAAAKIKAYRWKMFSKCALKKYERNTTNSMNRSIEELANFKMGTKYLTVRQQA